MNQIYCVIVVSVNDIVGLYVRGKNVSCTGREQKSSIGYLQRSRITSLPLRKENRMPTPYKKKRQYNILARAREWVDRSSNNSRGVLWKRPIAYIDGKPAVVSWEISTTIAVSKLMSEAYQEGFDAGYKDGVASEDVTYPFVIGKKEEFPVPSMDSLVKAFDLAHKEEDRTDGKGT